MKPKTHIREFASVAWDNTPAAVQAEYDMLMRQRDDFMEACEMLIKGADAGSLAIIAMAVRHARDAIANV